MKVGCAGRDKALMDMRRCCELFSFLEWQVERGWPCRGYRARQLNELVTQRAKSPGLGVQLLQQRFIIQASAPAILMHQFCQWQTRTPALSLQLGLIEKFADVAHA